MNIILNIEHVLAIYALLQIIYRIILKRHNHKMSKISILIDGGTSESFEEENEAIKYSKTCKAVFLEHIKFILGI